MALWHVDWRRGGQVFAQAPAWQGVWAGVRPRCRPLGLWAVTRAVISPLVTASSSALEAAPSSQQFLHHRDKPRAKTDSVNSLVEADRNSEPRLGGAARNLEAWGKGGWGWLSAAWFSGTGWGWSGPGQSPGSPGELWNRYSSRGFAA